MKKRKYEIIRISKINIPNGILVVGLKHQKIKLNRNSNIKKILFFESMDPDKIFDKKSKIILP
jgi:hypothetical protein